MSALPSRENGLGLFEGVEGAGGASFDERESVGVHEDAVMCGADGAAADETHRVIGQRSDVLLGKWGTLSLRQGRPPGWRERKGIGG